jgi:hypothetical protein
MIQINIGDHRSRYWREGWTAFPPHRLENARWARERAIAVAGGNPRADTYFRRLPRGRTLTALLADRSIWINYAYVLPGNAFGMGEEGGKELAISELSCRMGRWSLLATLIHELAHLNGVPGTGHAAEDALLACGLGRMREKETDADDPFTPYEPGIEG